MTRPVVFMYSVIFAVMVFITTAVAGPRQELADNGYPGFSKETGAVTCYARNVITDASTVYCLIYGTWPRSFDQIKRAGLVQTELLGYKLNPINPDDGSLDFAGDISFRYNAKDDIVSITWIDPAGRPKFETLRTKPVSLKELLERGGVSASSDPDAFTLIRNQSLLRTYGVMSMIRRGHENFVTIYQREPRDWAELASTGICGIDLNSTLPHNGLKIDGKGGENGLFVGQGESGNFSVSLRDAEGKSSGSRILF